MTHACRSPECCRRFAGVAFSSHSRHYQDVFALTLLLLRAITLTCRGHHDVVLENLALRHQLRTLQRRVKRPHLRTRDRMFWVLLATAWRRWRSALVLVQPETVVRWHRTWLRRRWAQRWGRNRAGRPPLDPAVARLLTDMAGANPLWGAPRIHGELRKLGIEISERTVSRRWRSSLVPVATVANLPRQPPLGPRLDGFLHPLDADGSGAPCCNCLTGMARRTGRFPQLAGA